MYNTMYKQTVSCFTPFLGQCLNFDCMWVLVLMLRRCITFLRTRGFGLILPLDQHIYLHKVTGMIIFIFSVVHTVMHLLNFSEYSEIICAMCLFHEGKFHLKVKYKIYRMDHNYGFNLFLTYI